MNLLWYLPFYASAIWLPSALSLMLSYIMCNYVSGPEIYRRPLLGYEILLSRCLFMAVVGKNWPCTMRIYANVLEIDIASLDVHETQFLSTIVLSIICISLLSLYLVDWLYNVS
jgi:hypothetical protein